VVKALALIRKDGGKYENEGGSTTLRGHGLLCIAIKNWHSQVSMEYSRQGKAFKPFTVVTQPGKVFNGIQLCVLARIPSNRDWWGVPGFPTYSNQSLHREQCGVRG
jgi:hypothetical protein